MDMSCICVHDMIEDSAFIDTKKMHFWSSLAAYISFGASPSDLLAATVMSAPAALAISKLTYPETKLNKANNNILDFEMAPSTDVSIMSAAVSGGSDALPIVLNIGAQLIAIISLIAMLDGWLIGAGSLINVDLSFFNINR